MTSKTLYKFNDNRIRLIQNNNGGNYVINRNLGIKQSRGGSIAFVMMMIIGYHINLMIKCVYFTLQKIIKN